MLKGINSPFAYCHLGPAANLTHTSGRRRGLETALQAMQKDLTLASYPYTDLDPEAVYKELCLASWPYADIKRTTTATQIAAEAADKIIRSWRKTVP